MRHEFLKHFSIIGIGTLASMAIGFLTTPIITRIVSPTEYGQFSIFTLYANVGVMVFYLGLDQSLIRYFYEQDSDGYRRGLLYRCVSIPVLWTMAACGVGLILFRLGIWQFELGKTALILLGVYLLIQIIYRYSLLMVRLQYKTKLYSMLGIIQKIIYVGIALPLMLSGLLEHVTALIFATVLSAGAAMAISVISEKRLWRFDLIQTGDCTKTYGSLLRYAYPYVLSMGVTTLFQAADKIALNLFGTYADVGIYSSTMTLVHVFSIIQTSFHTLWAPMAVEHYTKEKEDKTFYQKGNQAITVVMFFIGFSLILCKDVFVILLGDQYRQAAYILPFLIFNPIMYTISETTVSGLVFMKKSNMQVAVAVAACVSNVIGNAVLVPRLGCQGAAISTGIAYIIFFAMRTMLSNRYFYVDFGLKKFYLLTVIAVVYACYNTWIPFNFGSVIGYGISITALIFLYRDTIKWGIPIIYQLMAGAKGRT